MSPARRTGGRRPSYESYKDSGVEWLGSIPTHWTTSRLSTLACLMNGYPFDSEHFLRGEGIPLVRIRDLNATETEVGYIGQVIDSAWIDSGDIIIGMDGDFNVGRWKGPRALLNQRMCCLRPRNGSDPGFLAYVVPFPLKVINDLTYSTTVRHLSSADVRKILLSAPPFAEQRAISQHLDRETAGIDELVAKKERLIELLQEKRAAVITRAIRKGVDPDIPLKDSGVEWLGKIPVHWEMKPLKAVSDLQTGLTLGKKHEEAELVVRPYLRVANVQDGHIDLDEVAEVELPQQEVARYELHEGDVLITEGGDFDKLGRGYVWDGQISGCLHQNHVFAVRPRRGDLSSRFLAFVMSSGYGRAYFTATSTQSTNLASTNSTKLRNLPLPMPTVSEQDRIVAELDRDTAEIDTLVAKVREAIERLKELRTALISAAVTGKIDVRTA